MASLVLNLTLRRLRAAGLPHRQRLIVPVVLLVVGGVLVAVRALEKPPETITAIGFA